MNDDVTAKMADNGGSVGDNPRVYSYAAVYGATAVFVVIAMCARGYVFMKVRNE